MALYQKQFVKPYPNGYVDKPQKTTPVTAEILNMQDGVFIALEDFLTSGDVSFRNALTVGERPGGIYKIGSKSLVIGSADASGGFSLSVGEGGNSQGRDSCTIGASNTASGSSSVAIGTMCTASELDSFASGYNCRASGQRSHAEGLQTVASGVGSHAENLQTTASGSGSHAGGQLTVASGPGSFAMGYKSEAHGQYAHAEGYHTIAKGIHQHVQGRLNISDTESRYAHIVGNGTSDTDRKNIHTLDWQGNAWFAGDVTTDSGVSLNMIGTAESVDIDFSNYFT